MHSNRRTFIQRSSLVTAGLLTTAGTATADEGAQSETEGTIEGRLTYGGLPVENVTVAFDGDNGVDTERNGSYERELEPGTYAVAVDGDGYVDDSTEVEVKADETQTVDFDLQREWGPGEGELEVAVVPEGGGSTLDSRVTIYGNGQEHSVPALGGRVPDGDRWTRGFVVPEGWWEIRVTEIDGYGDGYAEVYVEADESTREIVGLPTEERTIHADGWISGTVTDDDGEPVPDAIVRITDDRSTTIEQTTDAGEFSLELPHGQYALDVSGDGYERVETNVAVRFGRVTDRDITLESD